MRTPTNTQGTMVDTDNSTYMYTVHDMHMYYIAFLHDKRARATQSYLRVR